MPSLLEVKDLVVHFPIYKGFLKRQTGSVEAVNGVSFSLQEGKTLGIVGESGCGKTTLGRSLVRLNQPTGGSIFFYGEDICRLKEKNLKTVRKNIQMVFQDPYGSLNPRLTVGETIGEPLMRHKIGSSKEQKDSVLELLEQVGLPSEAFYKFPHEFSGGQRQRIAIARALALRPKLIVADEPVSALDVSIQSQILNLMLDLQKKFSMSYVFISHDLSVVRHMADHIAVMHGGKMVEYAETDELFASPKHPYTKMLLAGIPSFKGQKQ